MLQGSRNYLTLTEIQRYVIMTQTFQRKCDGVRRYDISKAGNTSSVHFIDQCTEVCQLPQKNATAAMSSRRNSSEVRS